MSFGEKRHHISYYSGNSSPENDRLGKDGKSFPAGKAASGNGFEISREILAHTRLGSCNVIRAHAVVNTSF